MAQRIAFVLYGVAAYLFAVGTLLYAIAFVEGFPVPRTIDAGGPSGPAWLAIAVNVALLALFAVQHSVMARRSFKEAWTRIVPAPIERSTYVLASSLCLALLFVLWRPMPAVIWSVESPAPRSMLLGLSLVGWATVFLSSFLINHFDLFGLRQVVSAGREAPVASHRFRTPWLYRLVRHPLYLGFIVAFWAAPTMTAGRLLFALATLAYILVGIHYEERDLVREYGAEYLRYRSEVRGLVPLPKRASAPVETTPASR